MSRKFSEKEIVMYQELTGLALDIFISEYNEDVCEKIIIIFLQKYNYSDKFYFLVKDYIERFNKTYSVLNSDKEFDILLNRIKRIQKLQYIIE